MWEVLDSYFKESDS